MGIARPVAISIFVFLTLLAIPQVAKASVSGNTDEESALDGVGSCGTGATSFCGWQLISTNQDNDVIIVAVWCHCDSAAPTIADDAGLQYSLRGSFFAVQTPGPGFPLSLWEYYAVTDSSLNSDNITLLNADGSQATGSHVQVFAVQTSDTETIFDSSSPLPTLIGCPGFDLVNQVYHDCSGSVASSGNSFVFAITAINDAGPCPNPSTFGFTELVPLGGNIDIDYSPVAQPSSLAFTCAGGRSPGTDPMAMIVDAISLDSSS